MRIFLAVLLGLGYVSTLWGQESKDTKPVKRFGVDAALETYPQTTAKDALASVLKAIDNKRVDYLLAHLADPEFIDARLAVTGGKFEDLVKETATRLAPDSSGTKQLRRLLQEGTWETEESSATVRLKEGDDRQVYLRKLKGRWYLENDTRKSASKP